MNNFNSTYVLNDNLIPNEVKILKKSYLNFNELVFFHNKYDALIIITFWDLNTSQLINNKGLFLSKNIALPIDYSNLTHELKLLNKEHIEIKKMLSSKFIKNAILLKFILFTKTIKDVSDDQYYKSFAEFLINNDYEFKYELY